MDDTNINQPLTPLCTAGAAAVDTGATASQPEGAAQLGPAQPCTPQLGAAQPVALGASMDPHSSDSGEGNMWGTCRLAAPLQGQAQLCLPETDGRVSTDLEVIGRNLSSLNLCDFSSLQQNFDNGGGMLSQSEWLTQGTESKELDLRFMERPSLGMLHLEPPFTERPITFMLHPWHPDVLMDRANKLLSSGYVDGADCWDTCVRLRLSLWLWLWV